jgi:hypothetical protein
LKGLRLAEDSLGPEQTGWMFLFAANLKETARSERYAKETL